MSYENISLLITILFLLFFTLLFVDFDAYAMNLQNSILVFVLKSRNERFYDIE